MEGFVGGGFGGGGWCFGGKGGKGGGGGRRKGVLRSVIKGWWFWRGGGSDRADRDVAGGGAGEGWRAHGREGEGGGGGAAFGDAGVVVLPVSDMFFALAFLCEGLIPIVVGRGRKPDAVSAYIGSGLHLLVRELGLHVECFYTSCQIEFLLLLFSFSTCALLLAFPPLVAIAVYIDRTVTVTTVLIGKS